MATNEDSVMKKTWEKIMQGRQPGETRPGLNFILFLAFLFLHLLDMTTFVRQGGSGFTYGTAIWVVLMPLLANMLLESHKEPGMVAWWKDYWKYAKWGLGSLLIPVLEAPVSFLLETLGVGFFSLEGIGAVTATIAVYFPLGLVPFVFGEHAQPFGWVLFRPFTNIRLLVGLYMIIMFFSLLFYTSDKIDNTMLIVNDFMRDKFGYDVSETTAERSQLPLFDFAWETAKATYEKGKTGVLSWVSRAPSAVSTGVQKLTGKALGDAYTGKVDEKAKKKIGVYLDDVKTTEKNFFTDKQTILYTHLRAETLDDPLNIRIACIAHAKAASYPASTIYPKSDFDVAQFEDESLDCIFNPGTLAAGAYQVNVSAEFNFTTLAYVKSYFIEKERLRAYRQEQMDPFAENGITEKKPMAIYSNGPLLVGLGLNREQPISLDRSLPEQRYTFGITLQNKWKDSGRVKEVQKIIIILPEGFTLDDSQPFNTQEVQCDAIPEEEGCEESNMNIYEITPEEGFDNEYTYRVYMKVNQQAYDQVLGTTPLVTHYFKAMVSYTFQLLEGKRIELFDPAQETTTATQERGSPVFTRYDANEITSTSVSIVWTTNMNTTGTVEYWNSRNPALVYQKEDTMLAMNHTTQITEGLSPDRIYLWRIIAKNEYERTTESGTKTFTTLPLPGQAPSTEGLG